jgi:hypothetical protein
LIWLFQQKHVADFLIKIIAVSSGERGSIDRSIDRASLVAVRGTDVEPLETDLERRGAAERTRFNGVFRFSRLSDLNDNPIDPFRRGQILA